MGDLQRFHAVINGHETVVQLPAEVGTERGLTPVATNAEPAPAPKKASSRARKQPETRQP